MDMANSAEETTLVETATVSDTNPSSSITDDLVAETVARIQHMRLQTEQDTTDTISDTQQQTDVTCDDSTQTPTHGDEPRVDDSDPLTQDTCFHELVASVGQFAYSTIQVLSRGNSRDDDDDAPPLHVDQQQHSTALDFIEINSSQASDTTSYQDEADFVDEYLDKLDDSFESFETYVIGRVFSLIDPEAEYNQDHSYDEDYGACSSDEDLHDEQIQLHLHDQGQAEHSYDSTILSIVEESSVYEEHDTMDTDEETIPVDVTAPSTEIQVRNDHALQMHDKTDFELQGHDVQILSNSIEQTNNHQPYDHIHNIKNTEPCPFSDIQGRSFYTEQSVLITEIFEDCLSNNQINTRTEYTDLTPTTTNLTEHIWPGLLGIEVISIRSVNNITPVDQDIGSNLDMEPQPVTTVDNKFENPWTNDNSERGEEN
jgi:hypothetical protein